MSTSRWTARYRPEAVMAVGTVKVLLPTCDHQQQEDVGPCVAWRIGRVSRSGQRRQMSAFTSRVNSAACMG